MKQTSVGLGALLGGLTSLALTALFYLGDQLAGLPFVPFDIFDWLARVLPGNLVTLGIETLVNLIAALNLGTSTSGTAKLMEQIMAVLIVIAAGTILGGLTAALMRLSHFRGKQIGAAFGVLAFVAVVAIELSLGITNLVVSLIWLALLMVGWGWLLGRTLDRSTAAVETAQETSAGRRQALLKMAGGSIGVALAAGGIGRWLGAEAADTGAGQSLTEVTPESAATSEAATPSGDRIEPAPGTRPEVTPEGDFYRIDINTSPPVIESDDWQLNLDGLVREPLTLSMQDLLTYPAVSQVITMQCISNPIGGDLTSTSRWTGVPLHVLLDEAGVHNNAQEIYIESADGFYESVSLEVARDPRVLLVYAMNGVPLPVEHGFPLRIYIPNRYGMKQPKWIESMEVIDEQGPGYWVDRGWSEEALARTTSVIDSVATLAADPETGIVPIGGIAWSGDEGISKVEVQVDDGPWQEAQLREPPLSPLSWVQWRLDWEGESGSHEFRVRAYDGNGELQIIESSGARPDGATGIHSVRMRV
jgi:DMSO/TMAO reductase YedYZ molybdopterin-dependent catalytic subunit